jgi:glutamine amidotransferase
MGWNTFDLTRGSSLLQDDDDGGHAYFVHSYAAPVGDCTIARCSHGSDFSAAVQRDNFFGVQFHPERSSHVGARVLKNFLAL